MAYRTGEDEPDAERSDLDDRLAATLVAGETGAGAPSLLAGEVRVRPAVLIASRQPTGAHDVPPTADAPTTCVRVMRCVMLPP